MKDDMPGSPGVDACRDRCIVVCPRHDFIKSWFRAYFASGNRTPLVVIQGSQNDWTDDDRKYCEEAARFSGGMILDCSDVFNEYSGVKDRASLKDRIGWYTKKLMLYKVAAELSPRQWAWVDDDAEVTGLLDECFDFAESSPGFVCVQFYNPSEFDSQHPECFFRSKKDRADKMCWNSFMIFHGDANERLRETMLIDYEVEDDECIFCHLYKSDERWHDGFCDISIKDWQRNCKLIKAIPEGWFGKLLHYAGYARGAEVKKMWGKKFSKLPEAPFEAQDTAPSSNGGANEPVDAVFVVGSGNRGSSHGNEELRYALRSLEKNCKFVRDVYICGECPSFIDKAKVRHLKWADRFTHAKDANIIDKLRHACECPGISSRILFCSDDQFQTKKCTWNDFAPRYLMKFKSSDTWYSRRRTVWHSRLRSTLERELARRVEAGLPTDNVFYYQPHIWMQIDRDEFIRYARWCGYETRTDTIIASGYFNFTSVHGKPRKDFDHVFIAHNYEGIPEERHVAYHDGSYTSAMNILHSLFPNPSKYEVCCNDTAEKAESPIVRSGDMYSGSAATSEESSKIVSMFSKVRDNPMWHNLLHEISMAEELRLFGVSGWRVVWSDIMDRWSKHTSDGASNASVPSARSREASEVIASYMNNPESVRTVRFGVVAQETYRNQATVAPNKGPAAADRNVVRLLRDRIKSRTR